VVPTSVISRGSGTLLQLLAEHLFDLRALDVSGFKRWLDRHLSHWHTDVVFEQRARIRELRRAHPGLAALEGERRKARIDDAASPHYRRLEDATRGLIGAENAVAGLTHALSRANPPEDKRLRDKLEEYRRRVNELRSLVSDLTAESPERLALNEITARLTKLREDVGFFREVTRLEALQRSQGRSSTRSGAAFETVAIDAVTQHVMPELKGRSDSASIYLLRGVTLGAARTEIDQLIVGRAGDSNDPVEVLALVETKRNPNDLARGLQKRLENLSWLAGHEAGYDSLAYRTEAAPSGHNEGVAVHSEKGEVFRFDRASFRRFLPDLNSGTPHRNVYLVTRTGMLWGIGSAGLARIAHRVSSDTSWAPDDDEYLAGLLAWSQSLTSPVESPDILQMYADDPEAARQVLFLED